MTVIYRIEGATHDPNLTEGLSARVADPLWFLARQWQAGEFRGEDAATPVIVRAEVDSWAVNEGQGSEDKLPHKLDLARKPLQVGIERESRGDSLTTRDRIAAARRLMGTVDANAGDLLRKTYPLGLRGLPDDTATARLRLLARGAFDAGRLLDDLARVDGAADLPLVQGLPSRQSTALARAIDEWALREGAAFATLPPDAGAAWRDTALDYRYTLATAPETDAQRIVLAAREYHGGRLDWSHFDLLEVPEKLGESNRQTLTTLASPLRFAGQPAARFWEMENGVAHFADLAGGAGDLARSVLGAYAAVAGDDWFHLSAEIPNGHVARVTHMSVRDNFDEETVLTSTAETYGKDRVWRWFEHLNLSRHTTGPPLLFVPPALIAHHRGASLEEVHFRRDEMANLAWAIERRHRDALGRGRDAVRPEQPPPFEPAAEGDWTYAVAEFVPDYWFPLVPVRIGKRNPRILLRRGQVLHDPRTAPPVPQTTILRPGQPFLLDEAEGPFAGARIERGWRMARGMDGSRHVWVSRQKSTSTGPMGQTPLNYDALEGWPKGIRR